MPDERDAERDDGDPADDPFRTATHGHSPTLARLAGQHPTAPEIREVERLGLDADTDAVGLRLGIAPPTGCWLALAYTVTVGAGLAWLPGWVATSTLAGAVAGLVAAHLGNAVARWRWRRAVAGRLGWFERQAFPITGARGFLQATRPMIDVEFRLPPTAHALAAALQALAPGAEVIAIDDRTLRIIAPDRTAASAPMGPAPDAPVVDAAWLRRLIEEVLTPLHDELGVERVHLGGRYRPSPTLAMALTPPTRR